MSIKKISYECRANEWVDVRSLFWVIYMPWVYGKQYSGSQRVMIEAEQSLLVAVLPVRAHLPLWVSCGASAGPSSPAPSRTCRRPSWRGRTPPARGGRAPWWPGCPWCGCACPAARCAPSSPQSGCPPPAKGGVKKRGLQKGRMGKWNDSYKREDGKVKWNDSYKREDGRREVKW